MNEIKTYKDFIKNESFVAGMRNRLRNAVILATSFSSKIETSTNWIRFPYYHHVFDDEKKDFLRQLKCMANFGDFISMDTACEMLTGKEPMTGRYFCISFDDGFQNCFTNMMDITYSLSVPVIIYLPTDYIGLNIHNEEEKRKTENFYRESPKPVSFLSWEECKKMLEYKVSFGSHTCSHAHLIELSESVITTELENSKLLIEQKLGTPCNHFACPWGKPCIDFSPEKALPVAKKLEYKSFATTTRGKMQKASDVFLLKRDHLIANWENYQLKYFFGK